MTGTRSLNQELGPGIGHDRRGALASGSMSHLKAAAWRAPTKTRNFAMTQAGPVTGDAKSFANIVQTRALLRSFALTKPDYA